MSRFVKLGNRLRLKPKQLSACPWEQRITTDPSVVRAVHLIALKTDIRPVIGDSPALEGFRRVAAKTGMEEIARELGTFGVSQCSGRARKL